MAQEGFFARMLRNRERMNIETTGDGYIFVDRNGKYFEPILDFLRTGELVVERGLNMDMVLREADFYGVKLPMTDAWLLKQKNTKIYNDIEEIAGKLFDLMLEQFQMCAVEGKDISTTIFVRPEEEKAVEHQLATHIGAKAGRLNGIGLVFC